MFRRRRAPQRLQYDTCSAPSIVLLAFHDARYGTLAAMTFPRASTQSMEIFETKVIVGG